MLKLLSDEAALLEAVTADRDNDLPRLVYADFLDDHGRPERAEFIRLQCSRFPPGQADRDAFHRAAERCGQLLRRHREQWLGELPSWALTSSIGGSGDITFTRGFVERLFVLHNKIPTAGDALPDRTPLRELTVVVISSVDLSAHRWLGRVPVLTLFGTSLAGPLLAGLLRSDWLTGVHRLGLCFDAGVTDSAAGALAGCPHLSGLRTLALTSGGLSPSAVTALQASPHLRGCRIDTRGRRPG